MIKIIENFLSKNECESISNFILENEEYVKSLGPDNYSGTSNDSLTGRFEYFNYLYYQPGDILISKLKNYFGKCIVQCWANIFRKGECIKPHFHGEGFISANIFLFGDYKTGTYYDGIGLLENQKGSLVYFDSKLIHYTRKNKTNIPRITLAMDIFTSPVDLNIFKENPNRYYFIN